MHARAAFDARKASMTAFQQPLKPSHAQASRRSLAFTTGHSLAGSARLLGLAAFSAATRYRHYSLTPFRKTQQLPRLSVTIYRVAFTAKLMGGIAPHGDASIFYAAMAPCAFLITLPAEY